jgi:hypothetical protein
MIHTHHLSNHLNQISEIEALTRPNVWLIRDGVQLLLGVLRQGRTFGQVLASQTGDALVTAVLPRTVRIANKSLRPLSGSVPHAWPFQGLGHSSFFYGLPAACCSRPR